MNNEMTNTLPFKVKCIDNNIACLTVGKEYDVVEVNECFYRIKNDDGRFQWYYDSRFEVFETLHKDNSCLSVGDKVVINKISSGVVTSHDKNVKVGDIATVVRVGKSDIEVSNQKWLNDLWFSKDDVSLADNSMNYNLLTHQEVVQATLDGKELEIQYTDGTWCSMSPVNTTLHQLTTLNFRLKPEPSLDDKRKGVIKKLLENKVALLCKCWDGDVVIKREIVAITKIDDGGTYPYTNNCLMYEHAYAIDDNGDEITNIQDKTNNAFKAQISRSKGRSEYLGCFKTELEAFNAYKKAKESFIKEQAEKWKSQIDERAYEALMNYEVSIDD